MKYKGLIVTGVVFLVCAFLFIVLNPFVIIQAGNRGVVLNWGAVSDTVYSEGIHWRTPIAQQVVKVNVQIQKEEAVAEAASKDLQELKTTVALNYNVDPTKAGELYKDIGLDFVSRIIDPAIQEAVKAAASNFTAEEAVTKRQQVKEKISDLLKARLAKDDIILDEISIKDFDFSAEFNRAIEQKVTAEQNALAEKNKLASVQFQASQRVATATAEAEAIKIQAQSISAQGGMAYVQLKAIEKWDGKLPMQMIPGSTVPFIKIETPKQEQ